MLDGTWYAFGTPEGLTCIIDKGRVTYGCSGPIPGAPNGANLVSGGATRCTGLGQHDGPGVCDCRTGQAAAAERRLSYRQISCGTDGAGMTACINSYDQTGFVVSPGGTCHPRPDAAAGPTASVT